MIHALADVSPEAEIAADAQVWAFTTIERGVRVGAGSVVGGRCFIGAGTVIGEGVRIQDGCFITRGTVIEDGVFLGPQVVMTDDRHPRAGARYTPKPPTFRRGCSVGAATVILPGVVVGEGAMISAGAVVVRDVSAGVTVIARGARAA